MESHPADMPWVIFNLMNQQFAVSSQFVKEMVAMPKVASLPETPAHIRGVLNLRGNVMPVIDLRLSLGMVSRLEEIEDLVGLLKQREQDHKNWIAELEASVREQREFNLATDPHKCAFGKWYDHFETDNQTLTSCLKKFDQPHRKIHAIASDVKKLEAGEDYDAAYDMIQRTHDGDLSKMIKLFAEVRHLLQETVREIALVLVNRDRTMAVGVDSVETIERLAVAGIDEVPEVIRTMENKVISGTGRRKDQRVVMLIDADILIGQGAVDIAEVGDLSDSR